MAKINITKPTGNIESLNLISAFKVENNTYAVLDGEKTGSMGLPIIYVSKYTTKLEKITDANEWQSVKNYLKGIISGTNFEYVKISDQVNADEAYYTPLTLPQSSFDAIKARYVVEDAPSQSVASPALTPASPVVTPEVSPASSSSPVMPSVNTVSNTSVNVSPITPNVATNPTENESVMNLINEATNMNSASPQTAAPVEQVINKVVEPPKTEQASTPKINIVPEINQAVSSVSVQTPNTTPAVNETANMPTINFESDKETFLKACENMFDALISKYQKELNALEEREKALAKKEAEINAKMHDASEHLANAEASEQVANIAHDNSKRLMDLNNFMPVNPNQNTTN